MGTEPGNVAKILWPLGIAGLIWSAAAARSQKGVGPLVMAGAGAYAVYWAMENQKDYISLRIAGHTDALPF